MDARDFLPVDSTRRELGFPQQQQFAVRWAAHRSSPSDVIPWEEVRRQLWAEE